MSTEDRRVVGFKVTNDEFNVLQAYANAWVLFGFQVHDQFNGKDDRGTKSWLIDQRLPLHTSDNSTC